jgi:small conductance mechanosensitive channel
VDVNVAHGENLDHFSRVLEMVGDNIADNQDISPYLLDNPEVIGPVVMEDWTITMRIIVKTQAGRQSELTQKLQKRVLQACERESISLSYPRLEVLSKGSDG